MGNKIVTLDELLKGPQEKKKPAVIQFTIQRLDDDHWGINASPEGGIVEVIVAHGLVEVNSFVATKTLEFFEAPLIDCTEAYSLEEIKEKMEKGMLDEAKWKMEQMRLQAEEKK